MKKKFKFVVAAALALLAIFTMAGCDDTHGDPVNVAFVLGIADGENEFDAGIEEFAMIPALPGTDYVFISAEGVPVQIGEAGSIPDLSDRGYSSSMMERVYAGIQADLSERLASYHPSTGEMDVAAATELAVRSLNAKAVEGRRNILVYYCTGRSTTSIINMVETPISQLDIAASVSKVAADLKVDMSGIDEVIWYACGDFNAESSQPQLSSGERAKLKTFYEELFMALGANKVTFKDDLPAGGCYSFPDKPVSVMQVEDAVSGLTPEMLANGFVFPESQVEFLPDSAEFRDPEAAAEALKPAAVFLKEHPDINILLYGTCAGDEDTDFSLWLGKERAEKVKGELMSMGISDSRMTAVTVKVADDPLYCFGLTGSEASVNRKTVMADLSTAFAVQILAKAQ